MPRPTAKKLSSSSPRSPKPTGPVWTGPEGNGPNGGITFSALTRFLTCRERFRVAMIEGLRSNDQFNHRIEFGNLWHMCEECVAGGGDSLRDWEGSLYAWMRDLIKQYPTATAQIQTCTEIVRLMFPVYQEYWEKHPDVKNRTPILSEQVFDVPYKLPSGRVVRLRGKWDSVDVVKDKRTESIWNQENKTKGDIDEETIPRQLTFDLQTMIYVVALQEYRFPKGVGKGLPDLLNTGGSPLGGVRYNVVRRPRQYQGKKETADQFYARLKGIVETNPEQFFMRWKVEIKQPDIDRFRRECLDPILEALCNWYEFTTTGACRNNFTGIHWRHPFGSVNTIDEYGGTDLDRYLDTGSTVGLHRVNTLFRELQ